MSGPNERALAGVLACTPRLAGVRPALEVVPGMRPELVLHAGPPAGWEELAPPLRAGLEGAAALEGLSPAEAVLAPAQDHGSMAGGAGAITASTPVVVVEDAASGRRAFHFLMEGFGRALILGMTGEDVFARLRWLRDEAAPALDEAVRALGGIDCDEIVVEALRRGDELHNRNAAATSMLAERLAPGLARAGAGAALQERLFAFLRGNPQFFVAVSLAAAKLMLDAGHGVEGSTLVTALGANGRDCGLKVSGLGDRWLVAPAEVPEGVLAEGFGPGDAAPGCGDSLLVECAGLGASVLPAAPALWPVLGVDAERAARIHEDARTIALAEHPRYRVPALGDRGAPVGVDALRVAGTGTRPVVDIVMLHREPGRGLVGFGLTSPPLACFEQAAAALAA
ncbi:MAG TPA: DUF1116 domain-containing protein [Gaiellaceae bacterium]|nr:DUF1116 domain-containing protein [Gaiellaceae bacterium]